MSAAGALPPYRSEWEGQQKVEYDAFIKPSGSARFLRTTAIDHRPTNALSRSSVRLGLALRHPRLAQAVNQTVPIVDDARSAVLIDEPSLQRLPSRDRLGRDRKGKVTLKRFMRLGLVTTQSKRREEGSMRQCVVRGGRDRPARPVDRLIVLLQAEMGRRFPRIPVGQNRIARAEPNRFVVKFEALFEFP